MTGTILDLFGMLLAGVAIGTVYGAACAEGLRELYARLLAWCARLALRLHARWVGDYGRHTGVPAPEIAAYRRRQPSEVESPAASGGAREDGPGWPAQAASRAVPAQVTGYADAMWQASESYLPPAPQSHPYDWMAARPQDGPVNRSLAPYMRAGRPVEIPETPDRPPWMITTATMDAVRDEPPADEQAHGLYFGRHAIAAPVYGQACEADVLAGEQVTA